ncbi:MAG TPA: VWA domain-containing protein [Candidatus Binataceae bacterium]
MTNTAPSHVLELHEIKGVLTKFMRMLFPLEFRLDGISAEGAVSAAFRYPLVAGEVIFLPQRSDTFASREEAFSYYKVITAHLAARHEFGSFALKLSDLPGFDERGETGLEALQAYVATFADPKLAGAMLRLCEAVRIDAALSRRYRGLTPDIAAVNRKLCAEMPQFALSTMLFKAAADISPAAEPIEQAFMGQARAYFAPLQDPSADINLSLRQSAELYQWLIALIEAAQAGESELLDENARKMLNDLTQSLGEGDSDCLEGMDQEGDGSESGEPNQDVRMQVSGKRGKGRNGRPISPEELRRLLERGAQIKPSESDGSGEGGEGMYLTQLDDKQAQALAELQEQLSEAASFGSHGRLVVGARSHDAYYSYDEWDYAMNDYRRNWCRLREITPEGDDGEFYSRTLRQYAEMLPQIRRHFQRIRPASYRMVRGLEDGDDFDLDRAVEHRVARYLGNSPDPRVYKARKKEARDVATLFLLDMSASTDEPIHQDNRRFTDSDDADDWFKVWQRHGGPRQRPRRIIDVNKEALVIMAQALEEIGDAYAIMGFSGHGRDNVEFYVIKEFDRELSDEVKARVGSVEPKRSTRMGTAIRHAREKFKDVSSRAKHMILLSDGFPQDFDYGQDRRSNAYGIQDTMVALKELEMAGVMPFCITVDRTGHDYLRQMCQPARYLVIDDITALPKQLPKIYEQIVRW